MAFDLVGRFVIDAERLRAEDFHARDGRSTFPNIVFQRDSFNALSGSVGLKANVSTGCCSTSTCCSSSTSMACATR